MDKLLEFIVTVLYTPVFIFILVLYAIGWLGYTYTLIINAIVTQTLLLPEEYSRIIGVPLRDM